MSPFAGWNDFYVIVGSAAGALIGLQFVVMTLIANRPRSPGQAKAASAFATPTIVYFGAALLLSAISTAPWRDGRRASDALLVLGLCGIAYVLWVVRRIGKQSAYQPEFEDWLCHALLPAAAFIGLAAFAFPARCGGAAMFGIGLAALLLLFIGIHNAWDAVTYHVLAGPAEPPAE